MKVTREQTSGAMKKLYPDVSGSVMQGGNLVLVELSKIARG